MQKFSSQKKAALVMGALLLIGIVLQQYLRRSPAGGNSLVSQPGAPVERISVKADTNGWKEYINEKLGLSVKYPENVSLRGTAESDLAILTLPITQTDGKQALVTLTKKKVPLGKASYASIEEFWKDEQGFIIANSGVTSDTQTIELNGRVFWEAREDNRQINYMGLHRYFKQGEAIYEATLTMEGEKFLSSAMELYNKILSTFAVE